MTGDADDCPARVCYLQSGRLMGLTMECSNHKLSRIINGGNK